MEASPEATGDLEYHLSLLTTAPTQHEFHELTSAPIFTKPVLDHAEMIGEDEAEEAFPQYGLLAGISEKLTPTGSSEAGDPRVFVNIAAPSSTFICGSQGSGKSHTLSCLLENSLVQSGANKLPKPLCGVVFHYDSFISDDGGSPCEAVFLSSNPEIKVRVLCSPTNIQTIKVCIVLVLLRRQTLTVTSAHTPIFQMWKSRF